MQPLGHSLSMLYHHTILLAIYHIVYSDESAIFLESHQAKESSALCLCFVYHLSYSLQLSENAIVVNFRPCMPV